jgi:hypothetical protein
MHKESGKQGDYTIPKFDREKDMGGKILDPTQRTKLINDSKLISDRFTTPKF